MPETWRQFFTQEEIKMQIKIKKLNEAVIAPEYATPGAACFDIRSYEGGEILPEYARSFRTGLSFEIPPGFVMLLFSRSGHGFKHGVRLANCVGVIDSDYRGEVMVMLKNDMPKPIDHCQEAIVHDSRNALTILPGDRIAQAMILPVQQVTFLETETLTETERGAGGFGSTGA